MSKDFSAKNVRDSHNIRSMETSGFSGAPFLKKSFFSFTLLPNKTIFIFQNFLLNFMLTTQTSIF